jgi:ATPase family protein associated with various cellular activities (AAA)
VNLKLHKELIEAITVPVLKKHGLNVDEDAIRGWKKFIEVDLAALSPKQVNMLVALLEPHEAIRGVGVLLKDCRTWQDAVGGKNPKARSVRNFESLLTLYIRKATKHWLYCKDDKRGVWQAYYVNSTEFHPEVKRDGYTTPAYASMSLRYVEFGGRQAASEEFRAEDCVGLSVPEALARKGYIVETPEMFAEYERRRKLFHDYNGKIGKQFLATGIGTDNLDGNSRSRERSWYWHANSDILLDKDGAPARVVVDVFSEGDKDQSDRDAHVNRGFWNGRNGDDDEHEEAVDFDTIPEPDIPLHPMLATFDLKRHKRLRVDVGQLTEYVYDNQLGSKLVLPNDERNLVELLLAHTGGFQDIVSGKSGGSIILCAGVPGTGKTLTSEVYAEVMSKPLYSVQASQLGTSPDALEDELLKVFARSQRWGAILLLDEADVYVTKRGADLTQNAIVGVFLRVLEYYKGVLFLTTNRSDLVDDAIASRCLARIDYKAPGPVLQKRIWRVLADTAGIELSDAVIENTVARYPDLTGRDVKNLLKLARLVSSSRKEPISGVTIDFVKRFKPTVDE